MARNRRGSVVDGALLQMRERVSGMLVGVPLPPVTQLLRELDVSRSTLDRVYATLEGEGLLERRARKGVFVADRTQTGELAIVVPCWALGADATSPYHQKLSAALIRKLHERNPKWSVRMHLGRWTKHAYEFPATLDLLHRDVLPRLRGVFTLIALKEVEGALASAGVPVVGLSRHSAKNLVCFEDAKFMSCAVAHLKERGCRRIGVLARLVYHGQTFADACARLGVERRPELSYDIPVGDITERAGFTGLTRLWADRSPNDRPDGVILAEDVSCRGALRAAMHLGIQLGRDLKLVTFAVRGIDIPHHEPVSRVEFDLDEQARVAAQKMVALLRRNETDELVRLLPGQLIQGATT